MSSFAQNMQLQIPQTVPGRTGFTRPVENVLNYACTTASPVANQATFLTAWRAAMEALWLGLKDFSNRIEYFNVILLDVATNPVYSVSVALNGTYNATPGAPYPSICSAFLFLKAQARGKSSHGGMHLAGIPLAAVTAATNPNEFNVGYKGLLATFLAAYCAGFTDGAGLQWFPTILSRSQSSLIIPPPAINVVAVKVIAAFSAYDDDIGTMRRRKEGTVRG